jgi:hypothetical protein
MGVVKVTKQSIVLSALDVTEKALEWSLGLFFCSKALPLKSGIFSTAYQRGILTPIRIPLDKLGAAASPINTP